MASTKGKKTGTAKAGKATTKAKTSAKKVSTLPDAVARKLVDLLSNDDGFRRRFVKNPHAGLLEAAGIDPQMAKCLSPAKLASKKAIAASKDELLTMLTCHTQYNPVQLSV